MDRKKFILFRVGVIVFIITSVTVAVTRNSALLSIVSLLTGLFFWIFVQSKAKNRIDERVTTVQEKAAQMTYLIFTPTIGIGSIVLLLFARDEYYYLESLGMVLAYLTLFLIVLYAISYHFLDRKYGGSGD